MAVDAADALGVPRPVQHVQQELVEDGFVAARTRDDHGVGGGRRHSTSSWNKRHSHNAELSVGLLYRIQLRKIEFELFIRSYQKIKLVGCEGYSLIYYF